MHHWDQAMWGENKYGPGSVMDTPCVDNFLFGYSCPVYSSSKNDPNKGFTLYISPMLGYVYERYKYSDKYYGHSVRADYNYYFSKGFLVNIAIKNKYMLYAKYNDVGFDIGFSMCLSMMRAVDWF